MIVIKFIVNIVLSFISLLAVLFVLIEVLRIIGATGLYLLKFLKIIEKEVKSEEEFKEKYKGTFMPHVAYAIGFGFYFVVCWGIYEAKILLDIIP